MIGSFYLSTQVVHPGYNICQNFLLLSNIPLYTHYTRIHSSVHGFHVLVAANNMSMNIGLKYQDFAFDYLGCIFFFHHDCPIFQSDNRCGSTFSTSFLKLAWMQGQWMWFCHLILLSGRTILHAKTCLALQPHYFFMNLWLTPSSLKGSEHWHSD